MKKILALTSLVLSLSFSVYAQAGEEKKVAVASEALRKALVDADKNSLEELAAPQLSYGHSSGKIETKDEFIKEAITGSVDFISIDISNEKITMAGNDAIVRHIFYAKMKRDGKDDEIKISVLQVWQKQKGKWKLLARQAVKIAS